MTQNTQKADIATLSFEQALGELEQIVRRLETGDAALENAITDYERGSALRQHCEKKLSDARLKVEKIIAAETPNGDATVRTEAFENQ